MKMLSSLHAYNKAKKGNCLINSWNIEGFKVFVALRVAQPKGALQKANFAFARLPSGKRILHRFSFSALPCPSENLRKRSEGGKGASAALLHISNGDLNKAENERSFCTFSKCCAFQNSSSFEQLDCLASPTENKPVQPENVSGLPSSPKANTESLNSSLPLAAKPNDEKIVNFSKKHKLFNKKLSYLSSPSSPTAKELSKLVQMEYSLETFQRSNQDTCLTHKPSVFEGTWVQSGDLLTDCASSVGGELSLGQNLLIAYMPWEGYNFEDAILISERLVRDDLYTSVHIERYELETLRPPKTSAGSKQQTKLGAEEITRNIPDVSEKEIQKLDSYGIIKLGSWVEEGDILVGKITPINKKTISPYQKLLYTILEKQVKPIKDSSLRAPKGIKAKVVDIKYFLRKNPMLNLTKSTTSPLRVSSTTLVKQEFDKKNKQSLLLSALPNRIKTKRILKPERQSKKLEKTLVNSSTVRSLGVQQGLAEFPQSGRGNKAYPKGAQQKLQDLGGKPPTNVNRKFWKSAFILYKQRMDHNKKLYFSSPSVLHARESVFASSPTAKKRIAQPKGVQETREGSERFKNQRFLTASVHTLKAQEAQPIPRFAKGSSPTAKKGRVQALKKMRIACFSLPCAKRGRERSRKINKTYLNLFYKTQTLTSLPLLKQRKSLIVLNSFLPFLQRLKTKYKIQKSLDFLNLKNLYQRKAKSFLEQEKEQYIIKGKHVVKYPLPQSGRGKFAFAKRPALRVAREGKLQNSMFFPSLPSVLRRAGEPKGFQKPLVLESTQTERPSPKFLKKGKLPILSLTYASGNKRKGYSKSSTFAFGGASLAPMFKMRKAQRRFLISAEMQKAHQSRARKSEIIQNMETIHIYLAEKRKIQVGDKMAGRHGNKGIVSQILPIQDMPYLPDGTPIDMVLNPLGVPSRMNVGQIYECLLGLAGKYLGENYKIPSFDEAYGADASRSFVFNKLFQARTQTGANWLFNPNSPGKMRLYDGRNGECFLQPVTVGQAYILRLVHMVDDKIHARSTGPYSLVTQQPLRGRSKQGGQRLGEMEVWALEGYGAAFTLLEMLTIKSDDMTGRMTLWSNLILNKDIAIGTPESFKVLVCELQALCLDIGLFRYSQPTSLAPSATPQLSDPGGSEATKQGNVNDFNKFSLREINSLINLP